MNRYSINRSNHCLQRPHYLRRILPVLLFLTFFLPGEHILAQQKIKKTQDTAWLNKHSPHKASLYSAVLPGLGQAYNKKYWKIPVIYAGFATFAYLITINTQEFKKYKEAYIWKVNYDISPIDSIDNEYIYKYKTADQLKRGKDYYLRNVELTWIVTGIWYILNIVDAAVDAHLLDYNINEDLSLRIEPGFANANMICNKPIAGLTVRLKFR